MDTKQGAPICGKCKKDKRPKNVLHDKYFCKCGRPTEYNDEIIASAIEYLNFKMPHKGDDDFVEKIHSIDGLAVHLDISRETIRLWAKDPQKPEFFAIYETLMAKQARTLITGGLSEAFSGTITKLMLTKHGYRDSVENFNREVPVDPQMKKESDKVLDEYFSSEK